MRVNFLFSILIAFLIGQAYAQLPDSTVLAKSKSYTHTLHNQSLRGTQHLYNGTEYIVYHSSDGEHPYFLSGQPTLGNIKYAGEIFTDIPMLLDLEKEKLVISNSGYGVQMQLINDKVDEFSIDSHHFINLRNLQTIENGFYEKLYDGNTQVIAKRSKQISERLYSAKLVRRFDLFSSYYIKSGNQFIRIRSKTDLLKALNHKKELRSFIRKNKSVIQSRESLIVSVAQYFDTLNQ